MDLINSIENIQVISNGHTWVRINKVWYEDVRQLDPAGKHVDYWQTNGPRNKDLSFGRTARLPLNVFADFMASKLLDRVFDKASGFKHRFF